MSMHYFWNLKKKLVLLKRERFAGCDRIYLTQFKKMVQTLSFPSGLGWSFPSMNLALQIFYSKDQSFLYTKEGVVWEVRQIPQIPKYLTHPLALVPDTTHWANPKELLKVCIVTDSASMSPGRDHCLLFDQQSCIIVQHLDWLQVTRRQQQSKGLGQVTDQFC